MSKWKNNKMAIDIVLILFFAIILTLPAFWHGNFPLTYDGKIYLGRVQQVYESLRKFQLPPSVNFVGQDHNLGAMTSMYPWLTSLTFAVPLFILKNGFYSYIIGFIILNFFTGFNFYLLASYLSKKRVYRFLGTVVYLFNAYHIEEMFVRNAIGEALAYAFFPVVLLGLFLIWNGKKGALVLSLGVVLIANTHILSLLFTILMMAFLELTRLVLNKIDKAELCSLGKAVVITLIGSSYMIYQFCHILFSNRHMVMAGKFINYVVPSISFNELLNNHLKVLYNSWNIGLVCFSLLLFFLVEAMSKKSIEDWMIASWISLISLLFSFGVFHLPNKPFQIFQFAGRVYCLTVLCLSLACVLYFTKYSTSKINAIILIALSLLLGISSILNYKTNPLVTDPAEATVCFNKSNYYDLYHYSGCKDYTLELGKGKYKELNAEWLRSGANFSTYKVRGDGEKLLPMSAFSSVNYNVFINGKKVKTIKKQNRFLINIAKGKMCVVRIESKLTEMAYVLFFISVSVISLMIIISFKSFKKLLV